MLGVELRLDLPHGLDALFVVGVLILTVLVAWRGVKVRITEDDRDDE